ncbi:MAG: zinc ABC transporter substrate-binding protein [Clostridia bacterium]|nr:zinc ABC transporter substrate-binding protein [Clostridia bacterium]
MKVKKIIFIIIAIAIVIAIGLAIGVGGKKNKSNAKYNVIASNFASYDFLRNIIGENKDIELTYLIGPGKDAHSYDPTVQDLIKIQDSDLFVYVGGEMEKWSDKVVDSLDTTGTEIICIADFVETMEEKEVDGAEELEHDHDYEDEEEHHEEVEEHHEEHEHEHEEGAFDEHIWTSPENAIKMVNALEKAMEKIDSENATKYKENADKYITQIKDVDSKIQNIVDNKVRDRLIFADKMPMQYFIDYYNLKVSAAFDGCSTETEPSAKTIAYLQNKVKEEKIPVILYIELNPGTVAKTIADETGAEAMQIQTLHNVSLDDFNKGETWVSLMTRNIDVLKKALQ